MEITIQPGSPGVGHLHIHYLLHPPGTLRGNSEADFEDEEMQVGASLTLKSMLWFVYHTLQGD